MRPIILGSELVKQSCWNLLLGRASRDISRHVRDLILPNTRPCCIFHSSYRVQSKKHQLAHQPQLIVETFTCSHYMREAQPTHFVSFHGNQYQFCSCSHKHKKDFLGDGSSSVERKLLLSLPLLLSSGLYCYHPSFKYLSCTWMLFYPLVENFF